MQRLPQHDLGLALYHHPKALHLAGVAGDADGPNRSILQYHGHRDPRLNALKLCGGGKVVRSHKPSLNSLERGFVEGPNPAFITAADNDAGIMCYEDVVSDYVGRFVRDLLDNLGIYHGKNLLTTLIVRNVQNRRNKYPIFRTQLLMNKATFMARVCSDGGKVREHCRRYWKLGRGGYYGDH
jgi:hypothetical protein